jgi:hypothetical protein
MKIDLQQLMQLFGQSAADEELPPAIRKFAAQLTVLTRHLGQEQHMRHLLAKHVAELDKQLAEIGTHLIDMKKGAPSPAQNAGDVPVPSLEEEASGAELDEEGEAKAMADQITRETEEEVAAANADAAAPSTAIVPIRKAPTAENAS